MENTIENKAKFFAQYWGQKVYMNSPNCKIPSRVFMGKRIIEKDYLELKPLSSISDEDVKKCSYPSWKELKNDLLYTELTPFQLDYLRSKGYALDWNGITVEQQIEYGWIKLKINNK